MNLERFTAMLQSIIGAEAGQLPMMVAPAAERNGINSERGTFVYGLERSDVTSFTVHRRRHFSEDGERISRRYDAYALGTSEIAEKMAKMIRTDAALLRQDGDIRAAGEDPAAPSAHWYRIHPLVRHLALMAVSGPDDLVVAGRPNDPLSCDKNRDGFRVSFTSSHYRRLVIVEPATVTRSRNEVSIHNDHTIVVRNIALPASVVAALPGQSLRDVLRHPIFDGAPDMKIHKGECSQSGGRPMVTLEIEPRIVRLSDGSPIEE